MALTSRWRRTLAAGDNLPQAQQRALAVGCTAIRSSRQTAGAEVLVELGDLAGDRTPLLHRLRFHIKAINHFLSGRF